MPTIILVSSRADRWREFTDALQSRMGVEIVNACSAAEALDAAQKLNPLAVVIDDQPGDLSAADLVRSLLGINAMINTAVASSKPGEIFHSETEGLGILLQLSPVPIPAEAGRLAESLRQVTGAD